MKTGIHPIVIIPAYNPGPKLEETVDAALAAWADVLVVVDGSTDGSERGLLRRAASNPGLTVLRLEKNQGKGAAVLAGTRAALERGFTHGLAMDADGQHPGDRIREFMEIARVNPDAVILGKPIFPANIPIERLHWRKISVALTGLTVLGGGIADPLFGFRVYPLAPLLAVLGPRRTGRRYDFDTEAAVRLLWAGVRPVNVDASVRYFSRAEGGISHFRYIRDNALLAGMHLRLGAELVLLRWRDVLRHRREWRAAGADFGRNAPRVSLPQMQNPAP